MNNNFKSFDTGIRIAPGLASDPAQGRLFEFYANTVRGVLRQCVSESPLVWQDVTLANGTVDKTTLHWDVATGAWIENTLFTSDGAKVSTPDTATGQDFEVVAGAATGVGQLGGNLYLRGGLGDLGLGTILIDSPEIAGLSGATGSALSIKAGSSTGAGISGGDLTVAAGDPGAGAVRGDLDLVGDTVALLADRAINVGAQHAVDPSAPAIGDLYLNTKWNRMRQYNGAAWAFTDLKGLNTVTLFDATQLTLPATTATLIDGQTVATGNVVVFSALTVSPGYYWASVLAGAITWTRYAIGADPAGGFTLGDKIFVTTGAAQALSEKYWNGSAWVTNVSGNSGNLLLAANGGFTKITGTVLNLDVAQGSDPGSPAERDIYYNSSSKLFKYWDGSAWKTLGIPSPTTVPFINGDTGATLVRIPLATATMLGIEYSLVRGVAHERGVIHVSSDGVTASISVTGSNLGDPQVDLNASIDGTDLVVTFDAIPNGDSGSFKYVLLTSWLH